MLGSEDPKTLKRESGRQGPDHVGLWRPMVRDLDFIKV